MTTTSMYPRWMRRTAILCLVSFTWSFVLAPGVHAMTHPIPKSYQAARPYTVPDSAVKHKLVPPPKSLHENLKPLTRAQIAHLRAAKEMPSRKLPTLLDEVGRMNRFVPVAGQARYNTAIALFYEGAYRPAEVAFRALVKDRHPAPGLDRRQCARWLTKARACAGYHAAHERAGIREPERLDPLCGAESIAVVLRAMKRPFDRKSVVPAVRYTGEGSNMSDLVAAGRKLGLSPHVVTAGDAGLKLLPLPLVAAVEHDHFVAVIRADSKGVTYLCSDCGAWPGGERTISWKQWRLMEAGPFMTLSRPGSDTDRALTQLTQKSASAPAAERQVPSAAHVALAGLTLPAGRDGVSDLLRIARIADAMKAASVRQYMAYSVAVVCGNKPGGQPCCPQACPTDAGPTGGGDGGGGGGGDRRRMPNVQYGPSSGDPVNLATGEEEYHPEADLTVYNPIGPSVSLSRMYNSLRPLDPTYESDDFGVGWSHPYNITVYDPTVNVNARITQGVSGQCPVTGSDSPASGLTWDITLGGSTVATSSSMGGWSVSLSSGSSGALLTVSSPSTATVATGYEVRYQYGYYGYGSAMSAGFDILDPSLPVQVPQGGSAEFANTGTDAPGAGLTWDVIQGATTVATSAAPNGWAAAYPGSVTSPPFAVPGSYEVRTKFAGMGVRSCNFQVYIVSYLPKPGTRYLIEPNGARVPITASSVPSASNTTVVCSVAAGYPCYVEWKYSAGYTSGYYVITGADRSKIVTTTAAKAIGVTNGGYGYSYYTSVSAILYVVGQMADNSGNAINFWYGGAGPSGFPLLSSISDSNNATLVTFTHDSTSGAITAMSDRYSRSIYYSVSAYATTNVPSGWPQYFYGPDHVSQVVATGAANPPDRYAYGYQSVNNGEGTEQVPFLHTITVPSPTGTVSATATINYATDGSCYVTSLVDANGNQAVYTPVPGVSSTQVTIKDSSNTTLYQYAADFDANMSETGRTNGAGVYQSQKTFGDANDPYRPSQISDANGQTSYYTWDQNGNCLTDTSPRGTVTTYTISRGNFPLGELTQAQEGGKTATSITYYEPSGLPHTVSSPLPGTSGSGQTVTMTYTWDGLGNVVSIVAPGNNAAATITTTFNYTTDGAYSQAAAIMQPLSALDNGGHVTHFRWDAQGRQTSLADAVGIESDTSYNLAGQPYQDILPQTGQTGTGHGYTQNNYLYVGGPKLQTIAYDESGVAVRQASLACGAEGELRAVTGSVEPVTYTYDSLYRTKSISDGNLHATAFAFSAAGYLTTVAYPGGDTCQYPSHDSLGNTLQRIDGRGIVTNYLYNDAGGMLSDIQYPAAPANNVHIEYDLYGRVDSVTDGIGSCTMTFDDKTNPLTQTTTYSGLPAQVISHSYNADGSLEILGTPAGDFAYTYDSAQRPVGLSNPPVCL